MDGNNVHATEQEPMPECCSTILARWVWRHVHSLCCPDQTEDQPNHYEKDSEDVPLIDPPKRQDFDELREQLLREGCQFEDPYFLPDDRSIGQSFIKNELSNFKIRWKKPRSLSGEDPKFIVEGACRFDINQGALRDCWVAASIDNLTMHPLLFKKVVPDDQGYSDKYAGIFHFRFYKMGRWKDVVVDDRLPVVDLPGEEYPKLIFLRSETQNEFWSALLEKAYAKLHGSYSSLNNGHSVDALVDFTGGIGEYQDLKEYKDNAQKAYDFLNDAHHRKSLMVANIYKKKAELEGLIVDHSYSITGIDTVMTNQTSSEFTEYVIRLRNPYGGQREWEGKWSDTSESWGMTSQEDIKRLNAQYADDGEFWIPMDSFLIHFDNVHLSHVYTDGDPYQEFRGCWRCPNSSGGCLSKYPDTFPTNPQFQVQLDNYRGCALISLHQEDRFGKKDYMHIGFYIYYFETTIPTLDQNFFIENDPYFKPEFVKRRIFTRRFQELPETGRICIIPCTYHAKKEGEFLLRVLFSSREPEAE